MERWEKKKKAGQFAYRTSLVLGSSHLDELYPTYRPHSSTNTPVAPHRLYIRERKTHARKIFKKRNNFTG